MFNFNFSKTKKKVSSALLEVLRPEEDQPAPAAEEGERGPLRLGIISDTHGVLRPEVLERLAGCDHILHAGDIDRPEVLDRLQDIAPVLAVRGNNDWGRWADRLPRTRRFQLGGARFLMVHDRMDVPSALEGVDVVVFGHSHRFFQERLDGRLWLNPGSCGWPRFGGGLTMVLATLEGADLRVERVDLTR